MWKALLLIIWLMGGAASPVPAAGLERAVAVKGDPSQWITANDYPEAGLRAELEGAVTVHMFIGTDGILKDCKIEQSSGHDSLDGATCRLLTARARFEPALDARGQPIESDVRQRFVWRLPNGSDRLLQDDWIEWHYEIDAAGQAVNCVVIRTVKGETIEQGGCERGGYKDDGSFERLRKLVGTGQSVQQVWRRALDSANPVLIPDRKGWKRLLTQRGGFTYDREGVPRDCKMDLTRGPDVLITSMCETARGRGAPIKDVNGNPVDRPVRLDLAVFVRPSGG